MNTLTPQKAVRKSPNSISFDGKIINNPVDIAKKLNSLFCGISKKLSDSIDTTKAPKFNVYLSKGVSSSMYFRPISAVEVFNTINQLNSHKSCGLDGIETKFVKVTAEIIARVLTNLYNHCLTLGFFILTLQRPKLFRCLYLENFKNYQIAYQFSCDRVSLKFSRS